jgi:hypothetical protein
LHFPNISKGLISYNNDDDDNNIYNNLMTAVALKIYIKLIRTTYSGNIVENISAPVNRKELSF